MKTHLSLSARERTLLIVCAALLFVSLVAPAVHPNATYHHFADQRSYLGVPLAMVVLSNVPFALWGLMGLHAMLPLTQRLVLSAPLAPPEATVVVMARLFFIGLLMTAATSTSYHLRPDDIGLAVDRCGMVVAFAGLLGLSTALLVSARAGTSIAAAVLLTGPMAVAVALFRGNALPWACLQFGGMAWIAVLAWMGQTQSESPLLRIHWWRVIAWYLVAKVCESADVQIFQATAHTLSGHTLKHLAASCAAWPVCAALWKSSGNGTCTLNPQNPAKPAAKWPNAKHIARQSVKNSFTLSL